MNGRALIFLLLVSGFMAGFLPGQTTDQDQFPPGLRWKTLIASGHRLIFPDYLAGEARRIAARLDALAGPLRRTLTAPVECFPLILNDQTMAANGYVTLAPKRSEWYLYPPRTGMDGDLDWPLMLAVHEGRHMIQFTKFNQGITTLAARMFGEVGRGAVSMLLVPYWFWEGDAVVAETAWTTGGRGREPAFLAPAQAQLLAGNRFSYEQAYFGSYRRYFLNPYSFGFLMVQAARERFGADVWNRVIDRACLEPGNLLDGFSLALRAETGVTVDKLYRQLVDDRLREWSRTRESGFPFPGRTIAIPEKKDATHYLNGRYLADGTILAQKYGLGDPPMLVRISPDGRERIVKWFAPAEPGGTLVSLGGGKAGWEELRPHVRWGKVIDAQVVILDVESGKMTRLPRRLRAMSPAISPDGKTVAAVAAAGGKFEIVLIDPGNGRIIDRIPDSGAASILAPCWSADGGELAWIAQAAAGRSLLIWNRQRNRVETVIPCNPDLIDQPCFWGGFILYISPRSGRNEIHALERATGKRFQVTVTDFGAVYPALTPDGRFLLFSRYTARGYELAEITLDPDHWRPEPTQAADMAEAMAIVRQEGAEIPVAVPDGADYKISDYRSGRDFRIHSWLPASTDAGLGALVLADDILGRASASAAVGYRTDEKTLGFSLGVDYRAWWPVVGFRLSGGGRSVLRPGEEEDRREYWREGTARLSLAVPLNLSSGPWARSLVTGIHLDGIRSWGLDSLPAFRSSATVFGTFTAVRRRAVLDAGIRSGWSLSLIHRRSLTPNREPVRLNAGSASLFLPGLFRHHALRVQGALVIHSSDRSSFSDPVSFVRGYPRVLLQKRWQASIDYSFPLAYPEGGLKNIFYIKRMRGNLFLEHTAGGESWHEHRFTAVGLEWLNDVNIFSIYTPIQLGMRISYRFRDRVLAIEPVFVTVSW